MLHTVIKARMSQMLFPEDYFLGTILTLCELFYSSLFPMSTGTVLGRLSEAFVDLN